MVGACYQFGTAYALWWDENWITINAMQELAILAARALGTQRQFTAVADNVANVNTHGYRRMDVQFKEVISRPRGNATASYVGDRALFISQTEGAFEKTNNPLDVALNGRGFFAVDVGGTTHYTRKGNFLLSNDGTLITTEGNPVLDNAGTPIQLPLNTRNIMIAGDGAVSTEAGLAGQLGMYDFSADDMKKLQRTGSSAYIPALGASAFNLENATVRQGFLEASNVNPTEELVTMETVSRAYQNSLRLLKGVEDTEERAIRSLGNIQ
jgi:flagellar basal-body rod protein FlgF